MLTLKDKINRILGNNVRLLLPSYWWKRLFGMVVDRIDEVHPIVDSAAALDKLDVPDGSIASIKGELFSLSDAYSMTEEEYDKVGDGEISLLKKCTPISSIRVYNNTLGTGGDALAGVMISDSKWTYIARITIFTSGITFSDSEDMGEEPLCLEGQLYEENIRKVNKKLSEKECVITIYEALDPISNVDKFIKFSSGTDAYIKDEEWQPLARRKELDSLRTSIEESSSNSLFFYAPVDANTEISDVEKQHNAESYQKVAEGFESNKYYDIKVLLSTTQFVALDVIKTTNPAIDNGCLKLTFGEAGSGIDLQRLTVTSDGSATITIEGDEESGVELRDLYIYENYDGTLTELTDEQKAWNVETLELAKQGKAIVRTTLHGNTFILELFNEDNDYQFGYTQFSPSGGIAISVSVAEDGLSGIKIEESHFDSELSETSENAVQNKVVSKALNSKVDKVEGKQLSTEDFTTHLKKKLEGLSAFDPTEINNAIDELQSSFEALVSGNTSNAIESLNEFMAFLSGITDTQTLSGIVASLEQMIVAKQDKITDLDAIREGAALGATALQEHQDVSHLATKEELTNLTNEMVANEEVHAAAYTDLDSRLKDIGSLISGVAVTKEEFQEGLQSITDEIIANEEVAAASLNDLEERKADKDYVEQYVEDAITSAITTTLNTEV